MVNYLFLANISLLITATMFWGLLFAVCADKNARGFCLGYKRSGVCGFNFLLYTVFCSMILNFFGKKIFVYISNINI